MVVCCDPSFSVSKPSPRRKKCLIEPSQKPFSYQLGTSTSDETRPPLNTSPIFLTTILVRFLSGSLLSFPLGPALTHPAWRNTAVGGALLRALAGVHPGNPRPRAGGDSPVFTDMTSLSETTVPRALPSAGRGLTAAQFPTPGEVRLDQGFLSPIG